MTEHAPNPSTYWGRLLVSELAAAGVSAACVAPGSRSTPLILPLVEHPDVTVFSHLDERSAAYFALGRGKRTGEPAALVCTSGTAAANFHPAVIEADRSRTPMVVCTADRPPELLDSGANQTIEQDGLYADAVRFERSLPEPGSDARKVRSLRITVDRAVSASTGRPPGPVHLNVPFSKPLEPKPGTDDDSSGRVARSDDGSPARTPSVDSVRGRTTLDDRTTDRLVSTVDGADRGLIVAGPADPTADTAGAIATLAEMTGFPVLADPLSGIRYGAHVDSITVCGGYDAFLSPSVTDDWPEPDLVVQFGASPTSKSLFEYLERISARQLLVDPAGKWRDPTFTSTDLVAADPEWFAATVADRLRDPSNDPTSWTERFRRSEERHWAVVESAGDFFEGGVLSIALDDAPDPATVFLSNSMPVRDADRFGQPSSKALTILGNRGASGVDGITSTALGAGSATEDPLVLVTGDLAYYHDMNGLLALSRCDVDATIVVVNNDGGGIFHMLPIADHEAFEDWFETPHGMDFSPTADLYDLEFRRVDTLSNFRRVYRESIRSSGTHVVEVESDAAASFEVRTRLTDASREAIVDH